MSKIKKKDLRDKIEDIIGEDAYNEGAFMFDDNKMRFCFTPIELVKKQKELLALIKQERERVVEEVLAIIKEYKPEKGLETFISKSDLIKKFKEIIKSLE